MKRKHLLFAVLVSALLCVAFAAQAATFATVTDTDSLNVRSGPGVSYDWLGSVEKGGWVELTGESGNWYAVRVVETGMIGYMSKNFLSSYGGTGNIYATVSNPKPTQYLNLRSIPSYSGTVLARYYNGAVCTVLSENSGWYYVTIDGLYGYFRGEYLSVSGASSAVVHTQNGGKLNLRTGPSYAYPASMQIENGTAVSVLLKGSGFWMISAGGANGYTDSQFLSSSSSGSSSGYAQVKTGNSGKLNLRAQACSTAAVLGQYANGSNFIVLSQGETWCKVTSQTDGKTGYMMTKYLKLINLSSSPTLQTYNPNGGTYVNLRSAPSKETGSIYVHVPVGNAVAVLIPGEEWTQVRYGGTTGYIMTYFLR